MFFIGTLLFSLSLLIFSDATKLCPYYKVIPHIELSNPKLRTTNREGYEKRFNTVIPHKELSNSEPRTKNCGDYELKLMKLMKANTASKTAQYMALFRALETTKAKDKRLFCDPYAIHFLDRRLRIISRCASLPLISDRISAIIQKKIPGAYSSALSRTKFIDDLVIQTIGRGAKQLIILGAGFDTRALRLDSLRNIPVTEIDHPDTASLKINTLKKIKHCLPANVRYLQIDFNKQSLENLLQENNIDFTKPTTIIWEGVTNYLSKEAIDATFNVLKQFAKSSFVIFTYVDSEVLIKPASFFGAEKLLKDLEAIEERWTFGFNPSELKDYLTNYDYKLLQDAGAAEYRQQYIPERKELNRGYEFYRVAFAKKQ